MNRVYFLFAAPVVFAPLCSLIASFSGLFFAGFSPSSSSVRVTWSTPEAHFPLHGCILFNQVDLLQDRSGQSLSRSARVSAEEGKDSSRKGRMGGGSVMGNGTEEEEQQEVVSLRLVGLGMQLHSKSYSARFCFSMQDLDLEVSCTECPWG